MFGYLSYIIDDTSRVTWMGSGSYSNFQVPNTPGLPVGTSGDGTTPWNVAGSGLPSYFNSADLNEQQREQNYYGVMTYQKSVGDFNGQIALLGRASGVHFRPDEIGDLYFNGVASDEEKNLYSGGLQADGSYQLTDNNTIRFGGQLLDEVVFADTATTVFPVDGNGTPDGPMETLTDNHRLTGLFAGMYLQDEWKFFKQLTLNYGARLDMFNSSFDNEWQLSPRLNLIYQPAVDTTFHAGYSRYFTPPPVEDVSGRDVALFNGTSNESAVQTDGSVKAERSNYFDLGVSQKLASDWQVGLDGYYKQAHNQLDDGLFGQTLILSAFNYLHGRVYGVEATGSYTHGGFNAYLNLAYSEAEGEDWDSAQFLFNPTDLAYVQNHWIYLDHDQRWTGTCGLSYTWKEGDHHATRIYTDAVYGTGLRQDATTPTGENIPNGASVPDYYSLNCGVEQSIKLSKRNTLKARLDVVNLTDNIYQLRSGTGVGVNAAQYGERLGFFGSISLTF
jgi:outer membrane receptor protein involved in Fe transport